MPYFVQTRPEGSTTWRNVQVRAGRREALTARRQRAAQRPADEFRVLGLGQDGFWLVAGGGRRERGATAGRPAE